MQSTRLFANEQDCPPKESMTSIVLATYNGAEYILSLLESLLNQTRAADEVIICDDNSTDNTVKITNDFIKYNRLESWRVYENKTNVGWRLNFYRGLRKASGDYVFPCDQDDIWHPEKLRIVTAIMDANPTIGLLVHEKEDFFDNDDRTGKIYPKDFENVMDIPVKKAKTPRNFINVYYPGCSYCIRKSFLNKCFDFWVDSCPYDALLYRSAEIMDVMYVIGVPLLRYRRHASSAWEREKRDKSVSSEINWRDAEETELRKLKEFAENVELPNKELVLDKLNRDIEWTTQRRKLYLSRQISDGIRLLKYLSLYPGVRTFIKDWKLAFSKYQRGESINAE